MRLQTIVTVFLMVGAIIFAGYSARYWPLPDRNTTSTGGQGGATYPVPVVDGVIHDNEYTNATKEVGVEVYWSNNSTRLFVGMVSPGMGWVALGLAPDNGHMGASYVFCNVSDGVVHACDEYGDGRYSHDPDVKLGGEDNVLGCAGFQRANGTVVEFVIPLDSGDKYDKQLVQGNVYDCIVAYQSTSDDITQLHTMAGFLKIDIK